MIYDYQKDKKIITKKYKIYNAEDDNSSRLNLLPRWQISEFGFILSKNSHANKTTNNLINLANTERELKTYMLSWILHIETKLKAAVENIIMSIPEKGNSIHHPFTSNIYSKTIKNIEEKMLRDKFKKAIDRFKKSDIKQHTYCNETFGYIPFPYFIKYMYFGDIISMLDLVKDKYKTQILKLMDVNDGSSKLFKLIHDFRNYCAHDNSIILFESHSSRLPTNIVTSWIEKMININQKKFWNVNLLSVVIALRILLSDPQFKVFKIGYIRIVEKISEHLGPENIFYYRLNGGSNKTIEVMSKIRIRKLMKYNHLSGMKLHALRNEIKSIHGLKEQELRKFRSKQQIFSYLIEFDDIWPK